MIDLRFYLLSPNMQTEVLCLTLNTSKNWQNDFLVPELFRGTDMQIDIGMISVSP